MSRGIFITCNAICSECGKFLSPELVRDRNDVPTGELRVTGHYAHCSLYGSFATVKLPMLPIETTGKAA